MNFMKCKILKTVNGADEEWVEGAIDPTIIWGYAIGEKGADGYRISLFNEEMKGVIDIKMQLSEFQQIVGFEYSLGDN